MVTVCWRIPFILTFFRSRVDPIKQLEVFNDIYENLINLYRCIKYHCGELQKELDWMIVSRKQFFDAKTQLEMRGLTDILSLPDRKTFGTNKKNLSNTKDYLPEIQERLKNVVVENLDYQRLIKVYDRPKELFYLDSPYLSTERYYDSGFNLDNHHKLCSILKDIKGRFFLSYNYDGYFKEIYKDYNIELISRNNNFAAKCKPGEYKEITIKNFNVFLLDYKDKGL